MNIETELAEIKAIRSSFDDLIAHGEIRDEGRLLVSLGRLKQLKDRIDALHDDLRESAIAHANDENRPPR